AYDPNGVIQHTFLAGKEFTSSDNYDPATNTGPIIISSDFADKMGFANNYAGLVGKTVSMFTQNQFTGVGANVVAPTPNPGCQNGGPGCGPQGGQGMNQTPTTLLGRVVGVVASDRGSQIYFPMKWALG